MFIKENLNPKQKKTGDCVIRAIAKAENKTWLETFDILTELARKRYSITSDSDVFSKYLSKYEKINVFHIVCGAKKRYTVNDIIDWEGVYLISVAGHLTVVVDGCLYDTWNCSYKSAYQIWKVR